MTSFRPAVPSCAPNNAGRHLDTRVAQTRVGEAKSIKRTTWRPEVVPGARHRRRRVCTGESSASGARPYCVCVLRITSCACKGD